MLHFPDGWNGWHYWMAHTPYPGSQSQYENPSILVSDDKVTWVEPDGISNPIAPQPGGGFNADNDLIVDPDGVMWCIYRQAFVPVWRKSTDGITWSGYTQLCPTNGVNDVVSPAIVRHDGQYMLFYVNAEGANPFEVRRRTASAIDGTWSDPVTCAIGLPPTMSFIWHIDVISDGDLLFMLANYHSSYTYLAISGDGGLTWQVGSNKLIETGAPGAWDRAHYRGTLVRTATGFDLWYSANNQAGTPVWHVGYTPVTWEPRE